MPVEEVTGEKDLFGDLLWEAPEDDDVVRLGGSCVGRSLVVVQGSSSFEEDLWEANMFSKMYFFHFFQGMTNIRISK